MKTPTIDRIHRSVAIMSMLTITFAGAALAQRPPAHRNSDMWFGGHHPSQSNQALPEISTNSAQSINPDDSDNDDQVRYKVISIGVPGKTASFLTIVRAVNNREHVTGYSFAGDPSTPKAALTGQGFIWRDGKLEALRLLEGWPGAFAFGINDRDQIVGTANNVDAEDNLIQTAVLWDHQRPMNLGALHPGWISEALDVSIFGEVVGASAASGESEFSTPVFWYGGHIHALPLLPGENGGWANEINALGVIVGWQESAANQVPCLWYWKGNGYIAVNLGSLGGDYGQAFGINNFNKAVGYSLYPGNIHGPAFLWDRKEGLEALPLLPPDTDAVAYNLNERGQIVGDSQIFNESGQFVSQRAAIWENDTVEALQTLVPPNTPPLTYESSNINDLGDIAVNATNPDGSPDALLLVPRHRSDR
jgi:uncharacterized membrane protein